MDQPPLKFWLLGPLQIWRGDRRVDDALPGQRLRLLLSLFLTEREQYVPSERLMEYLWPQVDPATATRNLQVAISQLRRWLEPSLRWGKQ